MTKMTSSDYVDGVLTDFIEQHAGDDLDHSHAYGPQSPDLITYYLTELLGRDWIFPYMSAATLWEDPSDVMLQDFDRIERGTPTRVNEGLRRGDVLVFDGGTGFGTVGIYTAPGSRLGSVQMLTQNPGPVDVIDIMADGQVHRLLGAWRLTHGGECKALVSKFQQQLGYGAETKSQISDPLVNTDPPLHFSEWAADQRMPIFVSGRGHGKTAFIERLKAKIMRRPK